MTSLLMCFAINAGNLREADNFCVFNQYTGSYEDIISSVSDGSEFVAYVKPYGLNLGPMKWKEVRKERATGAIFSKTIDGHNYEVICDLGSFRNLGKDEESLSSFCTTIYDRGNGRFEIPIGTGDLDMVYLENKGLIKKTETNCVDYYGEAIDPSQDDNNLIVGE